MIQVSSADAKKALYVVNQHDIKLLKIAVKNEPKQAGLVDHAQLKIIPYGFKKAFLWRDAPDDPKIVILRDGVELTYHGVQTGDKNPKIHLKASSGYQTLLDRMLDLPDALVRPTPLFGFDCGHAFNKTSGDSRLRSGHVVKPDYEDAMRYEFYLMSGDADVSEFVNSTYFFSLLFSLDFMSKAQHGALQGGKIIAPILFLPMCGYWLVVRRSASGYVGQPRLNFYNNRDYEQKWLNRKTAHRYADGSIEWSTLQADEERLQNVIKAHKRS